MSGVIKTNYWVVAEYLGDFSDDRDDTKRGEFGPFTSRELAEKVLVALASQPAQHFWTVVGAKIEEREAG